MIELENKDADIAIGFADKESAHIIRLMNAFDRCLEDRGGRRVDNTKRRPILNMGHFKSDV